MFHRHPRLLALVGLLALALAWLPLILAMTRPVGEAWLQAGPPAAGLALLSGLAHPVRGWTLLIVVPAGLFLGLLVFP